MDPRPNPHYSPETSVKVNQFAFIHFVCSFWCHEIAIHGNPVNSLAGHSVEFRHHAHWFGGQTFAWFEGRKAKDMNEVKLRKVTSY